MSDKSASQPAEKSTWRNKVGLAEMLKGGVIMDVTTADQAKSESDKVAPLPGRRWLPPVRRADGWPPDCVSSPQQPDAVDCASRRPY